MRVDPNCCFRDSTSENDAFSRSTIITCGRSFAAAWRSSSTDFVRCTAWKEFAREAARVRAMLGSLWRRTTLDGIQILLNAQPCSSYKFVNAGLTLEWLGLHFSVLLEQNFHLAFRFLEFLPAGCGQLHSFFK